MKNKIKIIIIFIITIICFNPISLKYMLISIKNIVYSNSFISVNRSNNLNSAYEFDIDYYPYYNFLNDDEKKIYKQIYLNANKLVKTFKPVVEINVQQLKKYLKQFMMITQKYFGLIQIIHINILPIINVFKLP